MARHARAAYTRCSTSAAVLFRPGCVPEHFRSDLPQPRLRRLLPRLHRDLLAAAAPRQNVLLLVGSYFFYGYVHPWFLILIATSTIIDYCAARGMEALAARSAGSSCGSAWSRTSGCSASSSTSTSSSTTSPRRWRRSGCRAIEPTLRILLPVGISFYTFQAMSYTIDVYRGELRARRSLLDLAVFVSFFPHLVAGPIQRASFLLPQVETPRRFSIGAGAERVRADLLGLLQEAGHRRQRRRDRQQGVRARRSDVLRCCGPACSRSRSRSTPTSPPTPTSRAARRGGSASS